MRFSLTTMILLMALILALGILTWDHVSKNRNAAGQSLVIVMIDGAQEAGLDRYLRETGASAIAGLRASGVQLRNCAAPSPWYPAAAASLLTGRYPSEHGLTEWHAHLTLRAGALAEDCAASGFRTCAFIERDSILAATGALQGFHRIIDDSGPEVAAAGVRYVTRHHETSPVLGLIEINAARCGGFAGLNEVVRRVADELENDGFFQRGVLVLCAPGGWEQDRREALPSEDALKADSMKEFFVLKGEPLAVPPGTVLEKPVSLTEMSAVLRNLTWGGTFHLRDSVRTGRMAVTEMVLPPAAPVSGRSRSPSPHVCRLVHFDDLDFRAFVSSSAALEFQGPDLQPLQIAPADEALVRARMDAFLQALDLVEDLNVIDSAGPVLDAALAARLARPWQSAPALGHSLHAADHVFLAQALMIEGYPALAVNELRAAVAIEPEYGEAHFCLAKAFSSFGRSNALPYFRAYLERFGRNAGHEEFAAEARRYLEPE